MPLFRKVQLKFFGIITSILLAIFIAVLGSINIIMDTVMEHQTKIVLEQVAAGVEYDGVNERFFIERPDDANWQKFSDFPHVEPPFVPTEITTETTSEAEETTTTIVENKTTEEITIIHPTEAAIQPPQTTIPSESKPPKQITTSAQEIQTTKNTTRATRITDIKTTTKPQTTTTPAQIPSDPVHTQPPTQAQPQPNPGEQDPWKQWGGDWGGQWTPWGPWGPFNPWWGNGGGDGNNGQFNFGGGEIHDDFCKEPDGTVSGMANLEFVPVLDGYTIINDSDSSQTSTTAANTTTVPPFKPDYDPMHPNGNIYDRGNVPSTLGSIDFFLIMADENGDLIGIQNNNEMSDAVAQEYINEILEKKVSSGMANNYQFCTEKKENGTLMVFTDKSAEIDMMNNLKRTTVIVGLISIIILSVAAYFLSGLIVRPIKVAFDKQKQFVSDASHELKTPLTVISANADVLSGEIGENKWLTYIQDQADRMNVLVNDLLNLTRLENNSNFVETEFDLSKAIANTALPFECRAFDAGKKFILNIDEGIHITGSEQHIKQMAAIFIDNALKYSKENGTVRVTLTNSGGNIRFSVYNTGTGLKESEKEKIFERFYRSDASRNRATGGYGLGLAIAKSIIDKHKFKLFVDNAEGKSVCFIVTMK